MAKKTVSTRENNSFATAKIRCSVCGISNDENINPPLFSKRQRKRFLAAEDNSSVRCNECIKHGKGPLGGGGETTMDPAIDENDVDRSRAEFFSEVAKDINVDSLVEDDKGEDAESRDNFKEEEEEHELVEKSIKSEVCEKAKCTENAERNEMVEANESGGSDEVIQDIKALENLEPDVIEKCEQNINKGKGSEGGSLRIQTPQPTILSPVNDQKTNISEGIKGCLETLNNDEEVVVDKGKYDGNVMVQSRDALRPISTPESTENSGIMSHTEEQEGWSDTVDEDIDESSDVDLGKLKQKILGRNLNVSESDVDNNKEDDLTKNSGDLTFLRGELMCIICRELLYCPLSLHCGHSFCKDCLEWWFSRKKMSEGNNGGGNQRCPTCRSAVVSTSLHDHEYCFRADELNMSVNLALRATLAVVFPEETREVARRRKNSTKGETAVALRRYGESYEVLEGINVDRPWMEVKVPTPRGLLCRMLRRSIVLDQEDGRIQFSLCLAPMDNDEYNHDSGGGTIGNAILPRRPLVKLYLLAMEEDEVEDNGGKFPLVLDGNDDYELICSGTKERRFACSVAVSSVTGDQDDKRHSLASIDCSDDGSFFYEAIGLGDDVRFISFCHEETGAELQIRCPLNDTVVTRSPTMSCRNKKVLGRKFAMEAADAEEDEEKDEYDDFEDEDECDSHSKMSFIEDDNDNEDGEDLHCYREDNHPFVDDDNNDEDEFDDEEEEGCEICGEGGNLLVCDGGDVDPGCGRSFHVGCVKRTEIPEGDWICQRCANQSMAVSDKPVGLEGYEFSTSHDNDKNNDIETENLLTLISKREREEDDDDDSFHTLRKKKTIKKRRRVASFDDLEDDEDHEECDGGKNDNQKENDSKNAATCN